jgi:hypothetical protein
VIKLINIICGKNVEHEAKIRNAKKILVGKTTGKKVDAELKM